MGGTSLRLCPSGWAVGDSMSRQCPEPQTPHWNEAWEVRSLEERDLGCYPGPSGPSPRRRGGAGFRRPQRAPIPQTSVKANSKTVGGPGQKSVTALPKGASCPQASHAERKNRRGHKAEGRPLPRGPELRPRPGLSPRWGQARQPRNLGTVVAVALPSAAASAPCERAVSGVGLGDSSL